MSAAVLVVCFVFLILIRMVSIRLWRAGRLSDRSTTIVNALRFPAIAVAYLVLADERSPLGIAIVALAVAGVAIIEYRVMAWMLASEHS